MKRIWVWMLGCWLVGTSTLAVGQELSAPPLAAAPLEMEGDAPIPLLGTSLPAFRFFFAAEVHWQAPNARLQFRLLTYLHQHAGVRNFLLEGGYAFGQLLDRYLQTGEDRILLQALYAAPVCLNDQIDLFRRLHLYNQDQIPQNRIHVFGIDLEYAPDLVLKRIEETLPDKPLTAGVREKILGLKRINKQPYQIKEIRRFIRQWHKEMIEHPRPYERYWGDDFWQLEMLLENTVLGFDSPVLREFVYAHGADRRREARLYENFRLLQQHGLFASGNFFAQFGGIHTELNPAINWGYPTLAQELNTRTGSPVHGQVMTISRFFRQQAQLYERYPEVRPFLAEIARIEQQYPEEDAILCRLWDQKDRFPDLSRNFQYMLILHPKLEQERCR